MESRSGDRAVAYSVGSSDQSEAFFNQSGPVAETQLLAEPKQFEFELKTIIMHLQTVLKEWKESSLEVNLVWMFWSTWEIHTSYPCLLVKILQTTDNIYLFSFVNRSKQMFIYFLFYHICKSWVCHQAAGLRFIKFHITKGKMLDFHIIKCSPEHVCI